MTGSDMWRVDVAGIPVMVKGEHAYRHLEDVNRKLAKMTLALHKIASCASYHHGDCPDIAQMAIRSEDGQRVQRDNDLIAELSRTCGWNRR